MLRFHGSRDKRTFELVGVNSRLDAVQAAMLRVFLPELEGWNAARREAAARYAELGLGETCELPVDEPGHVYHVYCVRTAERSCGTCDLASSRSTGRCLTRSPTRSAVLSGWSAWRLGAGRGG